MFTPAGISVLQTLRGVDDLFAVLPNETTQCHVGYGIAFARVASERFDDLHPITSVVSVATVPFTCL
jgi:hypothetical protein